MKDVRYVQIAALSLVILGSLSFISSALVSSSNQLAQAVSTSGLVAHYTFDDGTATDSSGSGNSGTLSGTGATAGKIGSALLFDGLDDQISLSNPVFDISGEMSISLWVKIEDTDVGVEGLVTNMSSINNEFMYALRLNKTAGKITFTQGSNANGFYHHDSTATLTPGEWYHIVAVRSGNAGSWNVSLYINGRLDRQAATAVNPGNPGVKFIGREQYSGRFLKGALDDVRIYTKALAASEVTELFSLGGGAPATETPGVVSPPLPPPPVPTEGYSGPNYYIDFSSGLDTNPGTEAAPWKHSPGDEYATDRAKAAILKPGDKILFKGGVVYKGRIRPEHPGNTSGYITYSGNSWPAGTRAILDGGGTLVSGFYPNPTADYLVIEGFEIKNYQTAISLTGYNFTTKDSLNNIRIQNNLIHDSFGEGTSSSGRGIYFRYGNDLLIEGNTIHTLPYHAITADGSNVTIRNNHIYNIWGDGIAAGVTGPLLIEGNDIHDSVVGSSLHPDGMQIMHAPDGVIIRNNKIGNFSQQIFIENAVSTSQIGDVYVYNNIVYNSHPGTNGISGPSNGIILKTRYNNWGDVYVFNNTCIHMNGGNGCLAGSGSADSTAWKKSLTVRNMIVYNSVYGVSEAGGQPNFSSDYNLFYNQYRSWYLSGFTNLAQYKTKYPNQEVHSAYSDPQFASISISNGTITSFDAALKITSSAIDRGETRGAINGIHFNFDFAKNLRPQGNGWDIGAYESPASGVVQPPTTFVPGDFNNDGRVNSVDFSMMAGAWNTNNATYDLTKDGTVNTLDYTVMVRNWTL